MESNQYAAEASDLRAQLPFVSDRRRQKTMRERIEYLERQAKIAEQNKRREEGAK